ncbi:hypothetical protein ACX0G7_01435 [Flavitalea antarctica]
MKEDILAHLNEPRELEKMYRNNKAPFKREFTTLYPQVKGNVVADFWNERLNYDNEDINWGSRVDVIFVIVASLIAGLIAKLPALVNIDEQFFYTRNVGFIIFPVLTFYFAWKNKLELSKIATIAGATIVALIFINMLPGKKDSDVLVLSCIHMVLFLWSILGFSYVGSYRNNEERRLSFLKYNGDLVVMTTLIVIAAGILSGITINLFSLIGLDIEKVYFENVVIFGLPAAPIAASYLIQTNPQLVGRVSPVIAKLFSPLVLVMLLIYLGAMIYSGKDPYNDREFLMIFNLLLIGVMAIIFFSVAETSAGGKSHAELWVLLLLSIITVLVNGVALSAIIFRIAGLGITPNRAAVLGGNVLILINLLLVTIKFFRVVSAKGNINEVRKAITVYLPVYFFWTIVVTFLFPLIFGLNQ